MADCTKTVDFLREMRRICRTFNACQNGCPLYCEDIEERHCNVSEKLDEGTNAIVQKWADEGTIAIVQKWADEHPVMTWDSKLKELLPNAKEDAIENIMHIFCPNDIFGAGGNGACAADELCKDCWGKEAT